MNANVVLNLFGGAVALAGLIIEAVGILAIAFNGIRRQLKANPLALQSIGTILFTLGALTVALTTCR